MNALQYKEIDNTADSLAEAGSEGWEVIANGREGKLLVKRRDRNEEIKEQLARVTMGLPINNPDITEQDIQKYSRELSQRHFSEQYDDLVKENEARKMAMISLNSAKNKFGIDLDKWDNMSRSQKVIYCNQWHRSLQEMESAADEIRNARDTFTPSNVADNDVTLNPSGLDAPYVG